MADNGSNYRSRRFTCQDGLSLHFRDYGPVGSPATPVLCLPGLTRNSHDFHRLAGRLSADRRIICPDYRGRGLSQHDPDWRRYLPPTYLSDADQLLTALNLHRVIVIGTSLGGILAMGFAVAKPTRLAGVILNDVGPEIGMMGLARILTYIGRDDPQPDWAAAERRTRQIFPDVIATDDTWKEITRGTFREGEDGILHVSWDVNIVKPFSRRRPTPDLWPLFRALRHVPTLALRGEKSDVLAAETLQRMAEANSALQTVTVPGVGHVPTLEEPESRAALERFFGEFG